MFPSFSIMKSFSLNLNKYFNKHIIIAASVVQKVNTTLLRYEHRILPVSFLGLALDLAFEIWRCNVSLQSALAV